MKESTMASEDLTCLEVMSKSKLSLEPALLKKRLDRLLAGQPQHMLDFAAEIKAGKKP